MRKLLAYIITALILAVSCVSELEQGSLSVDESLEGAPVRITFSVPDVPVLQGTKSQGDITDEPYLDPDKMYVVVCGGSQSIKYIRKATLKGDPIPDQEVPENKYPFATGDRHVTLYEFEVELELSDTPRTFHILGNVDEKQMITGAYSYNSLPDMLSYDNKQAYWQKIVVPHIKAKKDLNTGKPMVQDGCYVPDDESAGYFQYIPLIRNFAKIQVSNAADNFELHSYAVIYFPEKGSVVPFRSNAMDEAHGYGFDFNPSSGYLFSGYETSSFEDLEEMNYLGNMPNIALNQEIPEAYEFEDPSQSKNGRVLLYEKSENEEEDAKGFYIFERGIPDDNVDPTFIIVCGKFEDDDNYYYYRLDLMETKVEGSQSVSKYYPIYRNFRYNIQLHRISSEGVETPELAALSSGADDISADVSMRHLSDISNGTTRLVVEPFMTRTYTGPAEGLTKWYELYARFFNDVYSDVPNLVTAAVKVELVPMTDGSDDILILYDDNGNRVAKKGYFFPKATEMGGVNGFRMIHFNTVEPLNETKTHKIRITGHNPGSHQDLRLYREVEITLQKKQPLSVTCTTPVQTFTNIPITVDITIPSVLPESMFPLEFIVEPEDRTLTPDTSMNINMPVVSGRSIASLETAFIDTPTFYYIRTLTWEEFNGLDINGDKRTFQCFFKTNRDFNATTIWVYNEFFNKDKATFENKMPLSLSCTNPVLAAEGTSVTLELTVHSGMPEDMFPMDFIVEPEDATLTPDTSKGVDLPQVVGFSIATDLTEYKDTKVNQYIRTLDWDEYKDLPIVNGNQRTFYCYFKTTVEESATTIWAYHHNVFKAHVSFENQAQLPTNHFWIEAVENCTVKIKKAGLKYKKDTDDDWSNYTSNSGISLEAGHKVSFKGGSADSKISWTDKDKGAFMGITGGQYKIGGDITSLVVGDDYEAYGATVTGIAFLDGFKNQTGLIDAFDLILPMKKLATASAFKSMFDGCKNLERGPRYLPATELSASCYRNMFNECKKLTYAPELPAATSVGSGSYQKMFTGCSSLNYIKMMGTKWNDNLYYSLDTSLNPVNPYRTDLPNKAYWWCDGVANEGTLVLNKDLENAPNWNTKWIQIIPPSTIENGWKVVFE